MYFSKIRTATSLLIPPSLDVAICSHPPGRSVGLWATPPPSPGTLDAQTADLTTGISRLKAQS